MSPDQTKLVYEEIDPVTGVDLWVLELPAPGSPVGSAPLPAKPFVKTAFAETNAALSPDGRWLLFSSAETGRPEIYVQRFPDGSGRQQVSVNGGGRSRWRPDGREIFYVSPDLKLMAVSFDANGASSPRLSIPSPLFAVSRAQLSPIYMGTWADNWDVFPDGKRFLISQPITDADPSSITVVLNWPAQLTK